MGGWLSAPEEGEVSLERYAAVVARSQLIAQTGWPGLLLRLGLPLEEESAEEPVVIARYAVTTGEEVRIIPMQRFATMKRDLDDQHSRRKGIAEWRHVFASMPAPSPQALASYSEHAVPASFANYDTREDRPRRRNEAASESDYLLLTNHEPDFDDG
ncbi:hypothetical protein M885DRAFT_511179 [Pelagophyceae sp. CCMP2097]|nr:hypothetical protein M885DRAFT_511179 [Pelagophyceae sp. CCMP2097]